MEGDPCLPHFTYVLRRRQERREQQQRGEEEGAAAVASPSSSFSLVSPLKVRACILSSFGSTTIMDV